MILGPGLGQRNFGIQPLYMIMLNPGVRQRNFGIQDLNQQEELKIGLTN